MGGSAFTMARDIGEGYVSVTERTFKSMAVPDMAKLSHEIERLLRELRGEGTVDDELNVVQARNRKILRLNSALTVMRAYRTKSRR